MVDRTTASTMGAFLDAFQKVADLANNSHGIYLFVVRCLSVWVRVRYSCCGSSHSLSFVCRVLYWGNLRPLAAHSTDARSVAAACKHARHWLMWRPVPRGSIVKTSTNPNDTFSSSDACIIDRRLYTYIWHATVEFMKKYNIPSRAMPNVSAKRIWARDILLTNDWTAKLHTWIHWNLVKS